MTQLAPADRPLIRLRTPRDVLATVPRLLGYRPSRSIVFLNLHDHGSISTMRVDLPVPARPVDQKRFITSLVGTLSKVPRTTKTLIVVYVDEAFGAAHDVPRASLVRPLLARLIDSGFAVHDALCVAADAWGAYHGPEAGVAHRLDELDEPAPGSEVCGPVAENVDALAALPAVGPLARRAFDDALDHRLRRPDSVNPIAAAEAALVLDPAAAGSDPLAAVLEVLLDAEARDVALFTWAWGARRGQDLVTEIDLISAGDIGPDDDSIALDLMGMGSAPPPDRSRIAAATALMSRVAALAADDVAHVPLTVLAWLHWSGGRSSVAARFVGRARELDPSYGLADLLDLALTRGVLPNWAYLAPAD